MEGGQGCWIGAPGGLCVRVREGQAWAGSGATWSRPALGWDLSSTPWDHCALGQGTRTPGASVSPPAAWDADSEERHVAGLSGGSN